MRKHFELNLCITWPIKDCRAGMLYVISKDQQSSNRHLVDQLWWQSDWFRQEASIFLTMQRKQSRKVVKGWVKRCHHKELSAIYSYSKDLHMMCMMCMMCMMVWWYDGMIWSDVIFICFNYYRKLLFHWTVDPKVGSVFPCRLRQDVQLLENYLNKDDAHLDAS